MKLLSETILAYSFFFLGGGFKHIPLFGVNQGFYRLGEGHGIIHGRKSHWLKAKATEILISITGAPDAGCVTDHLVGGHLAMCSEADSQGRSNFSSFEISRF